MKLTVKINLIPFEYIEREKRRTWIKLGGVGAIAALIALGGYSMTLVLKSSAQTKEIRETEVKIAKLEEVAREVDALEAKKDAISKKNSTVRALITDRFDYPKLMEDFVMSIPQGQIWISNFGTSHTADSYSVNIGAMAVNIKSIIKWLSTLLHDPKFSKVNLGAMSNGAEGTNFSISFDYRPKP